MKQEFYLERKEDLINERNTIKGVLSKCYLIIVLFESLTVSFEIEGKKKRSMKRNFNPKRITGVMRGSH